MIYVIYSNNSTAKFNNFDEITNTKNIIIIDWSHNQLTKLPNMQNYHWSNLERFTCSNNKLTQLPAIMSMPNLRTFICSYNQLTHLPENMHCPNLNYLDCSNNQITQLPANINMPNLQSFYCTFNKLTQLPDVMSMPNLRYFNCSFNQLTHLPENMPWPNLEWFYCGDNQLTYLPLHIMTLTRLMYIICLNNPLELSPQIARFINRINNGQTKQFNVYTDGQNVHNSNIQLCIKDSINALTTRPGIGSYNKTQLIETIISDSVLTCKDQLIEYLEDESVHSLLLLTWGEVLWAVLKTIELDFNTEQQIEIKLILNQEMHDAQCKCFTGRMSRVVNCLNGFSPLVNINIKDSDQIGNIIVLIKAQLTDNYNVETHKQLVKQELESRGFDDHMIDEWIGYIE
jgi:Leucine-rich repeat (LRR) protein